MLTRWEAEAPTEPPKGSAAGLGGSAVVQGQEDSEILNKPSSSTHSSC